MLFVFEKIQKDISMIIYVHAYLSNVLNTVNCIHCHSHSM